MPKGGQEVVMKHFIRAGVITSVVALTSLLSISLASPTHAAPPADFEKTPLVSGLNQPTDFRFMPNGEVYIAEKGGAIKIYHDGQLHDEPLITLAVLQTDQDEERGLLGIQPDPNFATNGYLYVSYTTAQNHDRLSRITVTGDTASLASEVILIESDQLGNIYHHGGEVQIGPDGKLYWAMGMNTYNPNSQNLSNVHGKILRMNLDGTAPADNPFVSTPGAVPQIWAYGLRNPFRFTFTPNGKLITGDVGGDTWEELNVVTKGANYGWPAVEGTCANCPYANPIYSYHHTPPPAKAGSITSAMVYTGSTFPSQYTNKFFIADYTLGWIKYLTFDSGYTSFISEQMFDDDAGTTVKLSQGPDGNMYQMTIFPGALYKIAPSGGNRAPTAVISATPTNGLAPLNVQFSGTGSSDPENTPLTYQWDFGDGTTANVATPPTKTYTTNGTRTVTLTVSDGQKTATATQKITVGSTAPTAHISAPANNSHYNAGDTINFAGTGTDAQDGTLPQSAYSWKVIFHHADHVHPFRDNITGSSNNVVIPRDADNIDTTWYEIVLTVTDSSGLQATDSIAIKPNLVQLTFTSNHQDASYTIDGIPKTGTYTEQAVVGVNRVLDATSPQYVPGGQYIFNSWSDGQPKSHTITTPAANATYSINFDKFITPPAPWQSTDVGQPTVAGYSSYDNGNFTIRGAGGDIWGPTDQFHYVYQSFNGDGTIIARATSQTNTDDWAKSGIMIKESTTAGSKYVLLAVTPANGVTFQYNFNGDGGSHAYTFPNAWLKLTRTGNTFTAFVSANGTAWTQIGQTTLAMSSSATAGLEVMSHKFDTLNTSTFDNVSVVSSQEWSNADVGAPRVAGSTTVNGTTHTLVGAGDDIWGTADQFQFNYQSLPADGEITARVSSLTGTTDTWAKAGVMIKQSTTAGSPYALVAATAGNGINFQHSFNSNSGGPVYTPPNAWLKLKRVGNTITSFASTNGQTWTQVGSATISMTGNALIGLFVSSHNGSVAATATFDNITVTKGAAQPTPIPAPWVSNDVGAPLLAGSTTYANGIFTINGAGDDIWGTADQFHFLHQPFTGDKEIVARVSAQDASTDGWAKSGLMIKQSTTAGSPYALVAITPAHGVTFQYNFNGENGGGTYTLPNAWLKLKRVGNAITSYTSSDGQTWTQVGQATLTLGTSAEIGLFVSSHNGSRLNESVFQNVSVQ